MAIKAHTITDDAYRIKVPKKTAFTIETPPDQVKLHQLMAISAQRGSGKGVILSSFIQGLQRQGCCDRIFILSPTIESNRSIFGPLQIDPDDEYSSPGPESINAIVDKCKQEMDEWEEYLEDLKAYKTLQKIIHRKDVRVQDIPPDLLLRAYERGFVDEQPRSKYGHKPSLALIVDDFQGSNLYSASPKNPFINLCLRHRHIARGLGLSIYICNQTYSGPNGMPRVLRQNLTSLLLGSQKNKQVLDAIAEEIGGQVDRDTFHKVYERAMHNDNPDEQNHNFLMIDFNPKHPSKMFRRNLNTFLSVNSR